MTTLSETIDKLKREVYSEDFNRKEGGLAGPGNLMRLHPEAFSVDRYYRFEGVSNPDDEAVVYAISSLEFQVKGTLVNGCSISSDAATDALLNVLQVKIT